MKINSTLKFLISLLLGVVIGLIGGSVYMLIVWIIAGILLGLIASSGKQLLLMGALYGFFLLFCFMISGYSGSQSLVSRFPAFAVLGLGGAVGGIFLVSVGYLIRRLTLPRS